MAWFHAGFYSSGAFGWNYRGFVGEGVTIYFANWSLQPVCSPTLESSRRQFGLDQLGFSEDWTEDTLGGPTPSRSVVWSRSPLCNALSS